VSHKSHLCLEFQCNDLGSPRCVGPSKCHSSHVEATHIWNVGFQSQVGKAKVREFQPWHVPSFRGGTSFIGCINIHFQLQSQMHVLQGLKTSDSSPWGVGTTGLTKNRGTNLETKLLEAMCMSRSKLFYCGLPNSISRLAFLNVCGSSWMEHIGLSCKW